MKLTKIFAGMAASVIAASCLALSASAVELKKDEKETTEFNMILITTDIAVEDYDSDDDGDFAIIGENQIKCKNVTMTAGGSSWSMDVAPYNSESKYLQFMLVNKWNSDLNGMPVDYIPGEGESLTVEFTLEGADGVSGNAGIAFQTNDTWNYRNAYNPDDTSVAAKATFPNKAVGVQGGEYGFDTAVDCGDVVIDGSGTYTVSIAASGTINEDAQTFDDGTTREGYAATWAMNKSYEPQPEEESKNESETESKNDSNSESKNESSGKDESKTDSSKAESSKAANNTTTSTKSTTTTTAASSAAATDSAASDNTNQATGATAGLALAGLALAGAVAVVSKRK
ncbi:NPXTG-anchored protein [Ruminococcus sp.]|uniref:NPXTG-anchored protein n=1 Tax=Ruminococcus sp. TaxID=41978 RepID=UPI0025F90374|nr:NPXTG-anchored protein [Ruminococcus sp.]